jgi:acyl-homoserine lactone acylase PvdQ
MNIWKKKLGREMAQKIIQFRDVDFPFWNKTIVSDEELKHLLLYKKNNQKKEEETLAKDDNNKKGKFKDYNKGENIDDSIIGNTFQNAGASNCWNVDGKMTSSGKPLLCNDPHLPNGMPGYFYISKFYLPDNIVSGASLPGTPILITGSNSYISWGITTENSDNTDICEELIQGDSYIKDNTVNVIIEQHVKYNTVF